MRISSIGIVRARDDSCNNAPDRRYGRRLPCAPLLRQRAGTAAGGCAHPLHLRLVSPAGRSVSVSLEVAGRPEPLDDLSQPLSRTSPNPVSAPMGTAWIYALAQPRQLRARRRRERGNEYHPRQVCLPVLGALCVVNGSSCLPLSQTLGWNSSAWHHGPARSASRGEDLLALLAQLALRPDVPVECHGPDPEFTAERGHGGRGGLSRWRGYGRPSAGAWWCSVQLSGDCST